MLDCLNSASALPDLGASPRNRLEPLHGNRAGQHGIRINDQYRICFGCSASAPMHVEIMVHRQTEPHPKLAGLERL